MYSIRVGPRRLSTSNVATTTRVSRPRPPRSTEDASEPQTKKFDQAKINTYRVPEGKLPQVLLMSTGFLLRGGTGCFVDGYSIKVDNTVDDTMYRPFRSLGNASLVESNTKIAGYPRPERPIELYEYESCPSCRKVREAISILDLDVMVYPSPRGAPNHRPKAVQLGGKQQFPFMVDPNTGTSMYESGDIVTYLFEKYGDGNVPLGLRLGPLTFITLSIYSLLRIGRGFNYRKAKYPERPLILWAYEISPFSKFVREALTELELPYLQMTCARGSSKRQKLFETVGAFQAPYLEDPNTGVALFESNKIMEYLESTYAM